MEHGPQQLPPEILWSLFIGYGVFLLIFVVFIAIGFWFVAGRIGRTKWAWALLSIIPFVNFLFFPYAFFRVLLYVLDQLNTIVAAAAAAQEDLPTQPAGMA